MKLLLVDPPELFLRGLGHTRQVQPLGLAYVGAAVADLCEVGFLLPDTRAYVGDDPWTEIIDAVVAERPDLLGLTAVTATFPAAAELARRVRAALPSLPIVLGGVHASTLPAQSLQQAPDIDLLVVGEGEATLRELVQAFPAGFDGRVPREPDTIGGLWLRAADGTPRATPPRSLLRDLDSLAPPLRDGLVWPQDVQPVFYQALVTTRGCPYHCIYCAVPGLDNARTRMHGAERVADEVAGLRERYDVPYVFFHDSVFTLSRKRTLAVAEALAARDLRIPFCIQTRADRLGDDELDALVGVGLHQIFFGVETGTAEGLRRIRKEMPLPTIRDAIARTRHRGVRASGFFMVGWPWEDAAAIAESIDFALSLDLDAISLFSATPLPGTELAAMAAAAGREGAPQSVDFRRPQVNLTAMTPQAYAQAYAEASARVDAYNQERMLATLAAQQPAVARAWHELPTVPDDEAAA
ncbi:MAG: hypothetical protein RIT45_4256 [Pseudomonadota bacterium]